MTATGRTRARPTPTIRVAAQPILRWAGGKTRLLPRLLERLPALSPDATYFEPFAGGAALFFALAPPRAVLGDVNADLIGLYTAIAGDVDAVIGKLEPHRAAHDSRHYYETRARWNDPGAAWSGADRAAAFIYLNKTCFNGLWRVNRAGDFNVPIGRYTDPLICVPETLRAAQAVLQRAELRVAGYRNTVAGARRGDVIYFDPPYVPASKTASFTSYASGGFGPDDQRELADLVRDLTARGVYVLVSNSDTPSVRELYAGMRIDSVKCGRAIAARAKSRAKVGEVIVVGYPHAVSGPQLELPSVAVRDGRFEQPSLFDWTGGAQ